MAEHFPSPRAKRFLIFYKLLWVIGLPIILAYLFWRGRKDSDYRSQIAERFGVYNVSSHETIWVHAVSLGELRSAVPLVRRMLDAGHTVVTTHFTPAGRRAATATFAIEIAEGRLHAVWVPFEFAFAFRRFFATFRPKVGLVMEIEIWPEMIRTARANAVPLYLCNAQYPEKSHRRDMTKSRWRADIVQGFTGAFVKSNLQRDRFADTGLENIHVTGELRFDQPIPPAQIIAGEALGDAYTPQRIITITSVVEGEDEIYIDLIKETRGPNAPIFIYVPRAPERFQDTATMLRDAGLRVAKRSEIMDKSMTLTDTPEIDVLIGDSFGEMYAYLAACDQAIIGGGFVPKGAHNISEPLALGKACIVGPHVWTIEFPVVEAITAGVCTKVQDAKALVTHIKSGEQPSQATCLAFAKSQSGAVERTLRALENQTNLTF